MYADVYAQHLNFYFDFILLKIKKLWIFIDLLYSQKCDLYKVRYKTKVKV